MKSTAQNLMEHSRAIYGEKTECLEDAAMKAAYEIGLCDNRETSYQFDDGSELRIKPILGRYPLVMATGIRTEVEA